MCSSDLAAIVFVLGRLTGNPVDLMLPEEATAEDRKAMIQALGLDGSVWDQFVIFVTNALHGDLGTSIATNRPVMAEVSNAVVNSIRLAAVATLIGFTFGSLFGFVAGYLRDSVPDRVASFLSVLGVSIPHYWLGMVLVIAFSVLLGWLPATGAGPDEIGRAHV